MDQINTLEWSVDHSDFGGEGWAVHLDGFWPCTPLER